MTDELETSIHSIAVDVCRNEPNIEAAAKKLRRKLESRKDEIIEEMYSAAILNAVHVARGSLMRGVKSMASPSRVNAGVVDGSAAFNRGFLASWQTPDGRWLKDVTGDDLTAFAALESEQAAGHAKVASFYTALATKAGSRKVGEALTDEQAMKLWNGEEVKPRRRKQDRAGVVAARI